MLDDPVLEPARRDAVIRTPRRRRHEAGAAAALGRVSTVSVLVVLCVAMVAPLVWMVLTSLRPGNTVFDGPLIPSSVTGAAYRRAWQEISFGTHFLNSLGITAVTVAVVVALSAVAGYAFAKLRFRFRQVIFFGLLTTLMMPAPALIIPVFQMLRTLHLVDTRFGLVLVYVATSLPFAVFLMRAFFSTLPDELIDAARVDGAGELRLFWQVMLPLAWPGLATVVIFQFLQTWNEFLFANTIIQTPENLPLQPMLYSLVGQYSTNWPVLTAALTMSVVPIIAVYVRMQRRFVAGMTLGAVQH
ncbi:MAG TPA: carbohydrate ABC transporter permease [Amycolatopsis sp.]|jgi:ABC-type glycerol-3-phosphate transport system permease component|nr:carbohydrate ABC transporter permease [Amycolatopsis sp.]